MTEYDSFYNSVAKRFYCNNVQPSIMWTDNWQVNWQLKKWQYNYNRSQSRGGKGMINEHEHNKLSLETLFRILLGTPLKHSLRAGTSAPCLGEGAPAVPTTLLMWNRWCPRPSAYLPSLMNDQGMFWRVWGEGWGRGRKKEQGKERRGKEKRDEQEDREEERGLVHRWCHFVQL